MTIVERDRRMIVGIHDPCEHDHLDHPVAMEQCLEDITDLLLASD